MQKQETYCLVIINSLSDNYQLSLFLKKFGGYSDNAYKETGFPWQKMF